MSHRKHSVGVAVLITLAAGLAACSGDSSWRGDSSSDTSGAAGSYGNIPSFAHVVTSGRGDVRYRATQSGTIWVGNEDRRFQVVSQPVQSGDEIVVKIDSDQVQKNGTAIYQQNLESKDRHAIYFGAGDGKSSSTGPSGYDRIPAGARSVASGTGTVTWTADRNGQVWIGDDKQRRSIEPFTVKPGDYVEVDIKQDQIKINGQPVYSQNLESKNTYSIFFMESGSANRQ